MHEYAGLHCVYCCIYTLALVVLYGGGLVKINAWYGMVWCGTI